MNLEGRELVWFQIWEKLELALTWLTMSTTIQIQFKPSQFENPREELLKLKQSSLVNSYFDAFNDLATRVYDMNDTLLLNCFVGGLHPDLKREVKSRSLASLM